jgi:acetylornithine/N-succinyldiaminopimelate aminotransferase
VSSFLQLFHPFPLKVVGGHDIHLQLEDGNKYVDLFTGLGVNLLGHNHPAIIEALKEPFPMHLCALLEHPLKEEVAGELTRITGFDKVFFSNSGAEAVEGALKFMWKWLEHRASTHERIFAFRNSFHGRTLGALSLTSLLSFQGFPVLDLPIVFLPFGDVQMLTDEVQRGCGIIIIEPVQGAAGVRYADRSFYEALEKLHKEFGFGLIADEIQTGLGRTGAFLSSTLFGLDPDIVTIAKGLGGGLPLGAILIKEHIANVLNPGDHGTTMGGNYLALRLAKVVLEQVTGLLDHVKNLDKLLRDILIPELLKNERVKEVRQSGLFIAIELKDDKADEIAEILFQKRYLVNSIRKRIIRLLPPLIITMDELKEAIDQIDEVIAGVRI